MRALILALCCAMSAGCGSITGEVLEGSGGYARKAGNLGVEVIANPKRYYERCSLIHALADSIRLRRGAYKDSIFRVHESRVRGNAGRYEALMAAIAGGNFGDPAKPFLVEWERVAAAYPIEVRWSGRTDGDGRFETTRLNPGEYSLRVAGWSKSVKVGLLSSEHVQVEYYGFPGYGSCEEENASRQGW